MLVNFIYVHSWKLIQNNIKLYFKVSIFLLKITLKNHQNKKII